MWKIIQTTGDRDSSLLPVSFTSELGFTFSYPGLYMNYKLVLKSDYNTANKTIINEIKTEYLQ